MKIGSCPRAIPAFALAIAGALITITILGPPRTAAQPSEIHGRITGEGVSQIRIAIRQIFAPASGPLPALAAEIQQTLADDLSYSGYFALLDPVSFSSLKAPGTDGVQMGPWRATGAEAVLVTNVEPQGAEIALEGRLFDTASSERVFGKRYAGGRELARRIAHRLASDLTEHFTGQPGVSLTRIAFVSKHGDGKELYVMDYDGQRVRRMTTTGTINLSPAWSPDGTRLAFLSFRQKYPAIFILEADGRITRLPSGRRDGGTGNGGNGSAEVGEAAERKAGEGKLFSAPDWSPDGKQIAYSSTKDGNCEIYVIDLASRRDRRLTTNEAIDSSPSWNPKTGTEIAFTSDRSGTPQVYIMDSDGANARRLTYEGAWNDSPAWSPKGDRIAYVSRIEGKFVLMMLDLGSHKSTRLLGGPFNCADPRWSPDGRHLSFASDREGRYDIYTSDADGSNVRHLTRGEPSFTPDWSR